MFQRFLWLLKIQFIGHNIVGAEVVANREEDAEDDSKDIICGHWCSNISSHGYEQYEAEDTFCKVDGKIEDNSEQGTVVLE